MTWWHGDSLRYFILRPIRGNDTHYPGRREAFKTEGRIIKDPGWLAVYGRQATGEEQGDSLVDLVPGESALTRNVEIVESQTKPPPRFTEATLLSAMESAGKLVEDEELREAMAARGLGTPATRAAIIEGLVYDEYIGSGRERFNCHFQRYLAHYPASRDRRHPCSLPPNSRESGNIS